MKPITRRFVLWTPRILCLLFAAFISLFALDVFDRHHGFLETLLALFMHLIPTFVLLVLLALAWRWEWIGTLAYTGLGVLYTVLFWGRFHWSVYAITSGWLVLIGALFLVSWLFHKELRIPRSKAEA